MRQFWVQYQKDFRANFGNFNAYIIFAAYYILSFFSALYLGDYFLRESEVMNAFFIMQPVILMLVIPAVTMRSWADEAKSGTLELLLTQPIGYFKLVLAKYAAAYSFFILMAATSLILFWVSDNLSVLDKGLVWSGYAGLLLCGALFTAAGCLVSALSRNNILSYIAAIFVLFFITQLEFTATGSGDLSLSLRGLNFEDNFKAFLSGSVGLGNIFYFIFGTGLCLWLNTAAIEYRKSALAVEKREFRIFSFLIAAIFASGVLGAGLLLQKKYDMTDEGKFTLTKESSDYLATTDKRINITLYEAKDKREEANSGYAVYAEFVEKTLKLIEQASNGAVRVETVLAAPFSSLERKLAYEDKIWFEEDNFGKKTFMAAVLSDNEGNHYTIPAFSNLRQNLLETDIMRLIKSFGSPKKEIAVIASQDDLAEMQSFNNMLREFYQVTYLGDKTIFIAPSYAAAIVINPVQSSTEFLLALEQYVLNGGNLIIFSDPKFLGADSGKPLISFLQNFGLAPKPAETLLFDNYELGSAEAVEAQTGRDIRSVLINGAGSIVLKPGDKYTVSPLLRFSEQAVGAVSEGKYVSNYIDFAIVTEHIQPLSTKPGKVLFFYDSDFIKDYLYVSNESKGHGFYQTIPVADNMLFLLRLMDYATGENREAGLAYRHYAINKSSIGNAILQDIRNRYNAETKQIENKLNAYKQQKENFYNTLKSRGFASVKNIGDISSIEQNIETYEDELYKTRAMVAKDYQTVIAGLTAFLILAVPTMLLVLLLLLSVFFRRIKQRKIRRLMSYAETH